ncbi:MAG: caspase family protein [Cyclobacteriaceae bacterium]|nr:caspase family protein [Cyclobacteriaceae bacterium]
MNKKALLIGNNAGLPGVKIDIENYKKYLKSMTGGQWNESEIIEKLNPPKDELVTLLDSLKNQNLDYLIIIFSGHAGMKRETILELNPAGDMFSETRFENISQRQVTILDCCRAYSSNLAETLNEVRMFKSDGFIGTKERFNKRILEAVPQQIKIYSCSAGEYSHDTPKGGVYSKNLIEASYSDNSEFIYFGNAHVVAAEKTTKEQKNQHPEIIIPRLLTSQQLILGIN